MIVFSPSGGARRSCGSSTENREQRLAKVRGRRDDFSLCSSSPADKFLKELARGELGALAPMQVGGIGRGLGASSRSKKSIATRNTTM